MPSYQQITAAREKAKAIREYAVAFRRERSLERLVEIESAALAERDDRPSAAGQPSIWKSERRAA